MLMRGETQSQSWGLWRLHCDEIDPKYSTAIFGSTLENKRTIQRDEGRRCRAEKITICRVISAFALASLPCCHQRAVNSGCMSD